MRVTQYLLICVMIIAMLTGFISVKVPAYGKGDMDGWLINGFDEWSVSDFWGT